MPLLARIVTCHRQWQFLEQWLKDDRLFGPEIEWVVVNDAPESSPSPETEALLRRRGIQLVSPACNLGRSGARNLGAEHATALWVELIDGDDVPLPLDPNTLSGLSADVVTHPVWEIPENCRVLPEPPAQLGMRAMWGELLPGLHPIDVRPASLIWKRSFLLGLGGFDGRFEGAEDLQLAFKAHRQGARMVRHLPPKQAYRFRKENHNWDPVHVIGHLRFFEWLPGQGTPRGGQTDTRRWVGQGTLYLLVTAARLSLRRIRAICSFLRWKALGQ
jgi:glycosyltransferase involved in cell wall biosynthesis